MQMSGISLTILHSEGPKLYRVLAVLSAVGLKSISRIENLILQVHEVNASSSRNGKRILSQLQEATQSHQVSHQGCGTPSKNPGTPSFSKPPAAPMPTAFTNLFKKKDTKTEEVIQIDDKKSKKRKREGNDGR